MKIAVTSIGPSLEDGVESRFGRCKYFIIIDTETMDFEAIENPNISLGGGAGIQSAQMMADQSVETVLTGNCGPNAYRTFGAAGIQVIVGVSGIVRDVVEQFKAGALTAADQANVVDHFGMGGGKGMGRGMGMGGGRGMGMGGGQGMGRGTVNDAQQGDFIAKQPGDSKTKKVSGDEITELKDQARLLSEQVKGIEERIERIQKDRDKSKG